ncbi:hypothetical protein Tco_0453637 [Tanacetum coccineum]
MRVYPPPSRQQLTWCHIGLWDLFVDVAKCPCGLIWDLHADVAADMACHMAPLTRLLTVVQPSFTDSPVVEVTCGRLMIGIRGTVHRIAGKEDVKKTHHALKYKTESKIKTGSFGELYLGKISLSKAHLPSLNVDLFLACYIASKLQVPLSVDNPFQPA